MTAYVVTGIEKPHYKIVPECSFSFYRWNEDNLMLDTTMYVSGAWKFIYQ